MYSDMKVGLVRDSQHNVPMAVWGTAQKDGELQLFCDTRVPQALRLSAGTADKKATASYQLPTYF